MRVLIHPRTITAADAAYTTTSSHSPGAYELAWSISHPNAGAATVKPRLNQNTTRPDARAVLASCASAITASIETAPTPNPPTPHTAAPTQYAAAPISGAATRITHEAQAIADITASESG